MYRFFFEFISNTRSLYTKIYPKSGDEDEGFGLSKQDQFSQKYNGYIQLVWLLTNGDVTKTESVYKLKAHEFLFWSQFIIEKNEVESTKNNN